MRLTVRERLRMVRSVFRLVSRYMDAERDPWIALETPVPLAYFGNGAVQQFTWYFEGASGVAARDLDEIAAWLMGCTYTRDDELFRVGDYWQHPCTFEQLRRGDCEDHALWAWRKLVELGYEAELVSGHCEPGNVEERGHVWVVFRQDERRFVLEGTARDPARVIRPLDEVRTEFIPHVSVDGRFVTRLYGGFARFVEARRAARRRKAPGAAEPAGRT